MLRHGGGLSRWIFAAGLLLADGACKSFEANLPAGDGSSTDGGHGSSDGAPADDDAQPSDAAPGMQSTVVSAADIDDTYLRMTSPTLNYGASDRVCGDTTDDRKSLLRIDVSGIPVGAEVVEADLHLWTGPASSDGSAETYSSHRMLESWVEGDEVGAAGTASWNERALDTDWTAAGVGVGSRGDDVMGSFVPLDIDSEHVMALEPALIQDWIDDEASNFGIVIVPAGEDGACFQSSDFDSASKRPSLVVRWLPP